MVRVKICGLNDETGFDAAVEAGADWIGLNFFPASPRYVTPARAAALAARAPDGPPRIGLFVAPTEAEIRTVLQEVRLDALQLYTDAATAAALRIRLALPVWLAVGVSGRADLPASAAGIDALLIEAKPPPGATRPGGNATAIDWELPAGWAAPCPWLLAGGLAPANVAAAIHASGAPSVDVSSGVESTPGRKDPALIRAFIAAARNAN